jgi:hypothetical protein
MSLKSALRFSSSRQATIISEHLFSPNYIYKTLSLLNILDLQISNAMHAKSIITLAAMLSGASVLAADCGAYGLCGAVPASSRSQLYAARQHVCGDTNSYQNSGSYKAAGGGALSWPGGNSQQVCWDAFDNILNQCHPEGAGLGYHSGSYEWNGGHYNVKGCKF